MSKKYERELAAMAAEYGCGVRNTNSGHRTIFHEATGMVLSTAGSTPSCPYSMEKVRADIKRGLMAADLLANNILQSEAACKTYGNPYPSMKTSSEVRRNRRHEALRQMFTVQSEVRAKGAEARGSFLALVMFEKSEPHYG